MCSVFEEIWQEGEKKGIEKGEKKGERKLATKMARKLLTEKTMSYAEIATFVEHLSVEEVEALDTDKTA